MTEYARHYNFSTVSQIDGFRYIKIQHNELQHEAVGKKTKNSAVIPESLALRSMF